mmetsp:Transcript_3758/g.5697  ORF Transcript_3758/g.5697 Transcript_3758/m.5697 type:complete len:93 (-) Transcript_3758:107-385(-)
MLLAFHNHILLTCQWDHAAILLHNAFSTFTLLISLQKAFIIAFILPSICYIRIRASKKGHGNPRLLSAWALLIFSICSAVLCSVQTIWRFFN